eukprot:TRINITY_DN52785_c0_g1_i2.p1 TRINITY_DN52785_c0_g1~~TRINITY_DN52785_c0_g1_i2.p1  ORF type:complete len:265 (-),score=45.09 TRINITY_DN52785_c0_g1_i2:219-1013(-)
MAFRADIQGGGMPVGGTAAGGTSFMPGTGDPMQQGLVGGQAVAGIEKTMKWKLFFFAGACITFATGVITTVFWILHFQFAPATFMSEVFLVIFGFLMIVLDFPVPHPNPTLVAVRDHCYKFVLFMTRFMGRGMWYLFLSTMVFASLWDTNINWFFGASFSLYLLVLGIGALVKGYLISEKLDSVRVAIMDSRRGVGDYIGPNQRGLSKAQFQEMVRNVTNEREMFTDDDLDYVMNALSFLPSSDGTVTQEEFAYWIGPGPKLLV